MSTTETVVLPKRFTPKQIAKNINDPMKTAKAVNLVFVNDSDKGILRKKWGRGFRYSFEDKKITDKLLLERISKLVIPPAWRDVWICTHENGHLQVTRLDDKNRNNIFIILYGLLCAIRQSSIA